MSSQGSVLPALSYNVVPSPTALLLAMGVVHFLSEWIWRLSRPPTSLCAAVGGSLREEKEKTDKQRNT